MKQSINLPILLYIDTAGSIATVALSKGHQVIASENNSTSNTHASFVQVAIEKILSTAQLKLAAIDAVVVTMGPGSYTGLRVGLSSAKGIAYALNKPLIGLSTLTLLATNAQDHTIVQSLDVNYQIFSMIDARRMEVFGAVYNAKMEEIVPEQPIELSVPYLENLLQNGVLVCIGSGIPKTRELLQAKGLNFIDDTYKIKDMVKLALDKWEKRSFEDLAYSSPAYLKDFYQIPPKSL